MKTRWQLIAPYMEAVMSNAYEIFIVWYWIEILPTDLVRKIGGIVLTLNRFAAECEFNIAMSAKFIAAFDLYQLSYIRAYNQDIINSVESVIPSIISPYYVLGKYKRIFINELRASYYRHIVGDIFQLIADKFTIIFVSHDHMIIEI